MANKSESIKVDGNKYVGGVDLATGKDLTVKVNIDVSDTLKGLKAVQREAKKTARVLRDVEERTDIKDLTDDEILKELSARGWEIDEASFFAGSEKPIMRHIEMNKNND